MPILQMSDSRYLHVIMEEGKEGRTVLFIIENVEMGPKGMFI